MNDLISIIVPIYKVEKYLRQCIDSVINQTYSNLEIILVNDGSPDNCPKICDEYAKKDDRIKIINKNNGGVSSARNVGLDNAKGNWIVFVDADDWIEKRYCEDLLKIATNKSADIVICGYNRVYNDKTKKISAIAKKTDFDSNDYLINVLNPQTGFGFCATKIFNVDIIGKNRFDESIVVGEDALFNIKISKNLKRAVYVQKELYNYRINDDSAVKRFDTNYVKKYSKSIEVNKKYIFENYLQEEIKNNFYNFIAFHVMLIAVNYCFHPENNIKNKKKLLRKICNYNNFKEGIEKSNYKMISLTRKVTLFTLKHKLYILTSCICKIRQMQNKRKGKK